jgi:cholest-4-en-3-one 26-monooxygenase
MIDPLDLVDPERFQQRGYPHDVWAQLRAGEPVARIDAPGHRPFWAITKHADIVKIGAQPQRFCNAQGVTLPKENAPPIPPSEMVVLLDPPKHGLMRRVVMGRLTPRAVRATRPDIQRIAVDVLDAAPTGDATGEFDFVRHVAAPFPLAVMAWRLGVRRDDWPLLYRWTNEIIGKDDPEFRPPGEKPGQTFMRARGELHAYFEQLIEERRRDPGDDLVSVLLAADLQGEPLNAKQLLEYCEVLVEAGNETTRNAISGGVLAFCEHPDQWKRLRAEPELLPDAVEEILRWVSPITHFARVATEDCELRGMQIRAGDPVALYFASANRDEDVFDDPFTFRIDRRPNPHLAFGFGEHFCMGAHLARVELVVMFQLLLDRFDGFELSGAVERLRSTINGSIKHLPVRYRIATRPTATL